MRGKVTIRALLATLSLTLVACDSKWIGSDASDVDSFSDAEDALQESDGDEPSTDVIPDADGECSPSAICNERVNSDGLDVEQLRPTVAAGPDCSLYVAWQDFRNDDGGFYDDYDIYVTASNDGGVSWMHPDVKVSTGTMGLDQRNPKIAVGPEGNLYLAWQDRRAMHHDIYFASSRDGGHTWTDPNIKLNTDGGAEDQMEPVMVVDPSGTIYVAWDDNRDAQPTIYFTKTTDSGRSWSDPNGRITSTSNGETSPDLAVDAEGTLYTVWEDAEWGPLSIRFAKSINGGDTWTDPAIQIAGIWLSANQQNPKIAVAPDGNIHVVFQDARAGESDIYFTSSVDGGMTWLEVPVLINSDGDTGLVQTDPVIAVDSDGIIIVAWEDRRGTSSDIYYAESSDGGTSWTNPNVLITTGATDSEQGRPTLVLDEFSNAILAWEDSRHDASDIFFCSILRD